MEGRGKVTGHARYVDDMAFTWHASRLHRPQPYSSRQNQKDHLRPRIDWNEFVIVTPEDIPGKNCIALIEDEQPASPMASSIILKSRFSFSHIRIATFFPKRSKPFPSSTNRSRDLHHRRKRSATANHLGADNTFKTYLIEKR